MYNEKCKCPTTLPFNAVKCHVSADVVTLLALVDLLFDIIDVPNRYDHSYQTVVEYLSVKVLFSLHIFMHTKASFEVILEASLALHLNIHIILSPQQV